VSFVGAVPDGLDKSGPVRGSSGSRRGRAEAAGGVEGFGVGVRGAALAAAATLSVGGVGARWCM
jgi:hypothetical protein